MRDERGSATIWIVGVLVVAVAAVVAFVFASGGRQEAEQAQQAVGEISAASSVEGQALLTSAIPAVQSYFAENGSLTGFGPEAASSFEPSIRYGIGAAVAGQISIRGVTPTSVVLVTTTGAGPLCAAFNGGMVTYGNVDALSAAQCTGGW
ncbi:MAG TPA: hypothetical protein VF382_00780 [Actinomycetota bacterium]